MSQLKKISSYGRFAFLLLFIGALLGIDSVFSLRFMYKLWPLVITMLGIGFVGIFKTRDRKESLYLSVGLYLVFFSGLALYCNFTHWGNLAVLWPLFITFSGISFVSSYAFCQRKYLGLLMGLLLISTSFVFFFVFSINTHLWWTVFLLAGASVLISERAR